ncbi:MAG TPA: Uma2 family endonuclease [Thermoanaerobaculia bacterium]|jgi:Uma2 family endonuclease
MAEPVRKMPADREPESPPSDDPFRYGSRWRRVRLPSGEVVDQQIPLTVEDLLDPQLGDEVPQSGPHSEAATQLFDLLKRHFAPREDVLVTFDMKVLWGIPGLPEPSPDVAVILGIRDKKRSRTLFDVPQEGVRPSLIIEVASPFDTEVRRNDYEKKVDLCERMGLPEYLIADPPFSEDDRLLWTGYRMAPGGRYEKIQPDTEGFLLSETAGLLFGVADDERTPRVVDVATRERLFTSSEIDAARTREAETRKVAEERAKAAEDELARLRAELERLRKP